MASTFVDGSLAVNASGRCRVDGNALPVMGQLLPT